MKIYKRLTLLFCGLLVFAVSSVGCSKKAALSGLVKVTGTVMLNGEPLSGASVVFVPKSIGDTSRSASGTTKEDGTFELTTLESGDGAFPGEYNVTITKREAVGKIPTAEEIEAANAKGQSLNVQYNNVVPPKYGIASTSGLTATVVEKGMAPVEFQLEK